MWVHDLLACERNAGRIKLEPPIYASLIASFEYIDSSNRKIFNHGWVNFPLGNNSYMLITFFSNSSHLGHLNPQKILFVC